MPTRGLTSNAIQEAEKRIPSSNADPPVSRIFSVDGCGKGDHDDCLLQRELWLNPYGVFPTGAHTSCDPVVMAIDGDGEQGSHWSNDQE